MPKEKEESSVFDVAKIREFIELMQEHELSDIDLKEGDHRIRLRRGGANVPVVSYASPSPPAPSAPRQPPRPSPHRPPLRTIPCTSRVQRLERFIRVPNPTPKTSSKSATWFRRTPSFAWSKR